MNILVKSCATCPFFGTSVATTLAAVLPSVAAKAGPFPGECDYPHGGGVLHFTPGSPTTPEIDAERYRRKVRMRIQNANELPEACPLRKQDVVVTLGS